MLPRGDSDRARWSRQALGIAGALLVLVVAVYWRVGDLGFVNFDDTRYVTQNEAVRGGLSWSGIAWAFGSMHASNWHPLTWLSHMADVELFGLDAGWHHRVNAAWHAASAVLLFLVLRAMTGAAWRSALVAALFAVHPLHVESVAWVSERKDVLSAFLWLLAIAAYARYARSPGAARYATLLLAFALGLLAKPMVVTLPVVLLLLDVWPLARLRLDAPSARKAWPLVLEKLPLLAMSAAASAVTVLAQSRGGTVSRFEALPISDRLANAALAYAGYLRHMLWPSGLTAVYPHPAWLPGGIAVWAAAGAAAVVAALTVVAVLLARRRPAAAVGWAWYLVTLLPVIGLVQVGRQGMADRYTYIPLIGIYVAIAWLLPEARARVRRALVATACAAVVVAAAVTANLQTRHWRDSVSLFQRALDVTEPGAQGWAWQLLGSSHFRDGRPPLAVLAYREALRRDPLDFELWMDLGASHEALGQHAEAAAAFREASRLSPAFEPLLNLGMALLQTGDARGAAAALERCVSVRPDLAPAWAGLGMAYAMAGEPARAHSLEPRIRALDPALADEYARRLGPPGATPAVPAAE